MRLHLIAVSKRLATASVDPLTFNTAGPARRPA
jgi:hypothetical protein